MSHRSALPPASESARGPQDDERSSAPKTVGEPSQGHVLPALPVGENLRKATAAVDKPKANGPSRCAADELTVVRITDPGQLAEHREAWQELADNAVEPNVFYEPWMLLPALQKLEKTPPFEAVLIYQPAKSAKQPARLCGFFPFERCQRFGMVRVATLRLWKSPFTFFCAPLIRKGQVRPVLDTLYTWASQSSGASLLDLPHFPGEGPIDKALADLLLERGSHHTLVQRWTRALLARGESTEEYVESTMTCHQRQELRRQGRRLAEKGTLAVRELAPDESPDPWIEAFLRLEAKGWKGSEGTALGSCECEREFFADAARAAHQGGRLMMQGLYLDDVAIALKCNFRSQAGSFAFKIAFDEEYSKFSPGVQLELANIERLHRTDGLLWMDSCAAPQHFMINRLWRERRTLQRLLISTGTRWGDLVVGALPFTRSLRRVFRFSSTPPGASSAEHSVK